MKQNTQTTTISLPKELTLLVTGTGRRRYETSDQLLFRTWDAALYFDKDNFDKLPHELIDRYNNYQKLLDSNRELKSKLKKAKIFINAKGGMSARERDEITQEINNILGND